jgi:PIN domain nuclease of toxin-antitoxin system
LRLLLDTHALLWALAEPGALSRPAREAITRPDSVVLMSAASAWEIGIKRAAGKLEAPADLETILDRTGIDTLPITVAHALAAGALPPLHADPFDRMLVAQAQIEDLTLVTRDPHVAAYDVAVLVA